MMLNWLKTLWKAEPPPAPVMSVAPVNLEVTQRVSGTEASADAPAVAHALYRLDAIYRHQAQNAKYVTQEHLKEFQAETRACVYTLIKAGLLTDADGVKIVTANKGLQKGRI